ncbi:hypothetical protein [Aeromicrobium phragmitis]|uniref:hypothetical protein n=1 Tax=Aeromicrobium phragmitis TaxID=2478914 RepID=UPI00105C67CD|nr:hypothetical protein [Aeromicrobium phragmitis]
MVILLASLIYVAFQAKESNSRDVASDKQDAGEATIQLQAGRMSAEIDDPEGLSVESWPESGLKTEEVYRIEDGRILFEYQLTSVASVGWVLVSRTNNDASSSIISLSRDGEGRLLPIQARVWADRVELAWQSDQSARWTVKRPDLEVQGVTSGSFVDRRRTEGSQTYIVLEEVEASSTQSAERTQRVYHMTVPGMNDFCQITSNAAAAYVSDLRIVEWNAFIEEGAVDVPSLCLDADSDNHFGSGCSGASLLPVW